MSSARVLSAALLVVAACALWRFGHHWSATGVVLGHDWFTMHRLDALYVEGAAAQGHLATWAPHILGGTPLWGVATKPMTYPPFLLGVGSLGATLGMNVLLFVHVLLAGLGTFVLARRLGLSGPAPLATAALLVLAHLPGQSFVSIPYGTGYAMAWWPWALICALDLLEGRARRWTAPALGALLALQWHAGGEPTLLWFACFGAAFSLPFLLRRRSRRELGSLAAGAVMVVLTCLGLVAVRLLPELAWIEASGRAEPLGVEALRDLQIEEERRVSGQSSRLGVLGRLVVEQTWHRGGLLIALLALLGAVRGYRRPAWLGIALGSLLCWVLASGALHELAYELLPGYGNMRRHTRFLTVASYGSILLAGYGLQHLWPRATRARVVAAAAIALLILVGTGTRVPTGRSLEDPEVHRAVLARELAPLLADPRLGRLHHQAHREQASWIALGIESTGGALGGPGSGNARYHQLLPEHTRPAALEARRGHVLDVLNVRYLATYAPVESAHLEALPTPERTAERRSELKANFIGPVHLYRRKSARPRLALVERPTLVVGPQARRRREVVARMRREQSGAQQVLVEATEGQLDDLEPGPFGAVLFPARSLDDPDLSDWAADHPEGQLTQVDGTTTWLQPGPTHLSPVEDRRLTKDLRSITVDLQGLGPGQLLLAETAALHPGWRGRIDGAEVPLALADGLVTLVELPAGARQLRLEYSPPGLRAGAWISGCTLAILALLLVRPGAGRRSGGSEGSRK